MSSVTRRGFVLAGLSFAGATGAAFAMRRLVTPGRHAPGRYGPLRRDPKGLLDLPEGFTYRVLDRVGDQMSDGLRVPALPDGMACFPGEGGTLVLMRNHEVGTDRRQGAFGGNRPPAQAYDVHAHGGVSRLVVDARSFERRSSNLALTGTMRNCSGGPSPWGWISCEENLSSGHGYAFLVRTDADSLQPPQRLDGFGRYNHEAAAVDPATAITYLSEDRVDGCLYRFVPHDPGKPFEGRLQALAVAGKPGFDTARGLPTGTKLELSWIDLDAVTPADDSLRHHAHAAGAARICRGEGLAWAGDGLYLTATEGAQNGGGQIFRLTTATDGGELELVCQSEDRDLLDMPDNLAVAPWGDVYVCEDGPAGNHLRVLTADGGLWDFARHVQTGSELAGVCFPPAGDALFVNLQQAGVTLVVTGPFRA